MDTQPFIQDFREAFGQKAALTLSLGYSDQSITAFWKSDGSFFKGLKDARGGEPVSLVEHDEVFLFRKAMIV